MVEDDGPSTQPLQRNPVGGPGGELPGHRYRLGSLIGRGGMGEVVAATDERFGREVAVKRLGRAMSGGESHERAMQRFLREALIQGRLDHPAIVPVHDLGVDEHGQPYFTMKRVTGATMAELITDPTQTQRLLRAFVDVSLAVELAHSRGVVHRDLKPQNIVLGNFGDVYVLDWGAAKVFGDVDAAVSGIAPESEDATIDGTVIGTPGYMAPEQWEGRPDVDGRADVYALGLILFEILVGERLAAARVRTPTDPAGSRPSLHRGARDIAPELDALCARATVHDRAARIQTPRELADAVQRYLDGDRDLAQRAALARDHLAAARASFDARMWRDAMRDAGRALALDPKLEGAAELVTRLMLEPPAERSPELDRAMATDDKETLRQHARAGARGYLGFLAMLPILIFGQRAQLGNAALLAGAIALNVWLLVSDWSYRSFQHRTLRIALGNMLLVGVVGKLTSPYLFAPAIATLATTVMVLSPNYERPRQVLLLVAGMAGTLIGLHILETTGVLTATTHAARGGVAFTPPLLEISETGVQLLLALATLGLVAAAGGTAFANRRAERFVRDRLHRQTWLLRQLVT